MTNSLGQRIGPASTRGGIWVPASSGLFGRPSHLPSQRVPAAHSVDRWPLHSMWHDAASPHSTEHPELPVQSTVQPPFGHLIVQLLLPSHESVDPVSRVIEQSLPPPQVTWLFTPVTSVHSLVPSQVDVQFDPQAPSHTD